MGIFRTGKIKNTPEDFVRKQLDILLNSDNEKAIKTLYQELVSDYPILNNVEFSKYLKETLNVHVRLFGIAWDRTISRKLGTKYYGLVSNDSRVEAFDLAAYNQALSKATEAGMGTFEYIAFIFLSQLLPNIKINDPEVGRVVVEHSSQFVGLYKAMEGRIKELKFIN